MRRFLNICFLETFLLLINFRFFGVCLPAKPEVRIIILSQLTGVLQASSSNINTKFLVNTWQNHFNRNLKYDPSWPFNATIELYDSRSDASYTYQLLKARVQNTSLPPVTIITGPEYKPLSKPIEMISNEYNIPWVFHISLHDFPRPPTRRNAFSVIPPTMYINLQVVEAYVSKGVKTLVAVSMLGFPINVDACFGAANYAISRGISVVGNFSLTPSMSKTDVRNVVNKIIVLNPDSVLWCDYYSAFPEYVETFNPVPVFKELNYLPKALTLLDNLDAPALDVYKREGLFKYISGGAFSCDRAHGQEYTEGDTPYSSLFRPNSTYHSWSQELNFGNTADSPSSAQLFYRWYERETGTSPIRLTLAYWAVFDTIEAALYRAAMLPHVMEDNKITPEEVIGALRNLQVTTPSGRVVIDSSGDNTVSSSLMLQALSETDSAHIVYPVRMRTAELVYPMPTWDERIHSWKLIGDSHEVTALSVAVVCSLVLLTIMITVIVHRRDQVIRMLHYLHIAAMCLCGICVCMSSSLAWQVDNKAIQCRSYLWLTFLPGSFIVHLINMKAYRLSVFMKSSINGSRPKHFTQLRVLKLTLMFWLATIVLLAIASTLDGPSPVRYQLDVHRASLDEYHCEHGQLTAAVLYLLVVFHIICSILSVISVRNGMEDFRDGLVIKESFLLLYVCLGIAFIMTELNLPTSDRYLYRTIFVCIGVTTAVLRLLISRCSKYWLPEYIQRVLQHIYAMYLKEILSSISPDASSYVSRISAIAGSPGVMEHLIDLEDGPAYVKEAPKDDGLEEMIRALRDPARFALFTRVAEQSFAVENVAFLKEVLDYEEECENLLIARSTAASDSLQERAKGIFQQRLKKDAPEEVNISSIARSNLQHSLSRWPTHYPFVSTSTAIKILDEDCLSRKHLFQETFREISVMTYQNLWKKFRSLETESLAIGD